ncbi:MAG: restriction endonuclease [Armatimonadota bacterium]
MKDLHTPLAYADNIRQSGLDIYASIDVGDPQLWIPAPEMEFLLNSALKGTSLAGLPLRTRSKVVKAAVCEAMGYTVPRSFRKTQPRFPGQCLDTYVQKSSNLQIWNEEIAPNRRYAIIKVAQDDTIVKVKVVTGDTLALLDTTGTLTRKYQARITPGDADVELVSDVDTENLGRITCQYRNTPGFAVSPTAHPSVGQLMPIELVCRKLEQLVGNTFVDAGIDQERNRGGELHRRVCAALGYQRHQDDGAFPDIRHQLIEVKLQTSPTIDLGLVSPASEEPLDTPRLENVQARHCDVRYVVFYAERNNANVTLTKLYVSTGERFFARFVQFGGLVTNAKLQIPLPASFFED